MGTQYRSAIFYYSDEQKAIAERVMKEAQAKWKDPIATTLEPADTFYAGEPYHQNYLDANPGGYCTFSHRCTRCTLIKVISHGCQCLSADTDDVDVAGNHRLYW